MKQTQQIITVVYAPTTEESKLELSKRVAYIHAEAVLNRANRLNCPRAQKIALIDAIIETVQQRNISSAHEK